MRLIEVLVEPLHPAMPLIMLLSASALLGLGYIVSVMAHLPRTIWLERHPPICARTAATRTVNAAARTTPRASMASRSIDRVAVRTLGRIMTPSIAEHPRNHAAGLVDSVSIAPVDALTS